jgi:hypothetical protein
MVGQCLCGGVTFEFDGPISSIELCHCSRCRRATGSVFAAEFYVHPAGFRWVRGENLISFYDAPILRNPPPYRISFCHTCGSQVPTVREGSPAISIPTGLVQGELPARASDHIFVGMKAPWWDGNEIAKLPVFEAGPAPEFRARMLAMVERK